MDCSIHEHTHAKNALYKVQRFSFFLIAIFIRIKIKKKILINQNRVMNNNKNTESTPTFKQE